jgi:hypothetical protein
MRILSNTVKINDNNEINTAEIFNFNEMKRA